MHVTFNMLEERSAMSNYFLVHTDLTVQGAVVRFALQCGCGHQWDWQSVGSTRTDAKLFNTLLAGSILYTGSQPTKVTR